MILTLQGALLAPSLLAGSAPASRAPALRPPLLGTLGRAPSCPPRCVCGEAAERDAARGGPALEGRGGGDPGGTGRDGAGAAGGGDGGVLRACDPTQEGRGRLA